MSWKACPALLLLSSLCLAEPVFKQADSLYFRRNEPGSLQRSNALLEESLRERPDDAGALWRLSRGLTALSGRAASDKERVAVLARAEEAADKAIAADPREPQAYYWKGMALGRKGQARGMLRAIGTVGPLKRLMRKVLELDPGHAGAHQFLGEMLRRLPGFAGGSKKEAVLELEKAAALAPDRVSACVSLARAYRDAGEADKARRTLERALEVRTPDDPAAAAEDLEEARRLLRELGPR